MVVTIAEFVVPVLIAPLAVIGLRPLFALFVREGIELFADFELPLHVTAAIGRSLALINVVIIVITWLFVRTCIELEGPHLASVGIAIGGLGVAMLATLVEVRTRLSLVGAKATLVSLITFAGGNLPFWVSIPLALAIR